VLYADCKKTQKLTHFVLLFYYHITRFYVFVNQCIFPIIEMLLF